MIRLETNSPQTFQQYQELHPVTVEDDPLQTQQTNIESKAPTSLPRTPVALERHNASLHLLICSKDWLEAEKLAKMALTDATDSQAVSLYEKLETIYTNWHGHELKGLLIKLGKAYRKNNQFELAERLYAKAFGKYKNFEFAYALAQVQEDRDTLKKSMQTIMAAFAFALLDNNLERQNLCIDHIRKIDLLMKHLNLQEKSFSGQKINVLSADFVGFVSQCLIERKFFQNSKLPSQWFLYLANDLLKTLSPKPEKDYFNVAKEISLMWKEFRGQKPTLEEKVYRDSPHELNVIGEISNGLKYSSICLTGMDWYSSVTSAVKNKLWSHIPFISAYSGSVLFGYQAITKATTLVLQKTRLSKKQREQVEPWLNMVGSLALGFLPKVHATSEGVHYHYPSREGHSQTISKDQLVTLHGDTVSFEKTGLLETPEGSIKGVYSAAFKLEQIHKLDKEHLLIQVATQNGKKVPVEFRKVQGQYGPEISVRCDDKNLEKHWQQYFRPKEAVLELPVPISKGIQTEKALSSSLACGTGLTLGAIGSVVLQQPLIMGVGAAFCAPSVSAAPTERLSEKIGKSKEREGMSEVVEKCEIGLKEGLNKLRGNMPVKIYPQYHQYTTPLFSYLFKVENSSSLTLKVSSASQKCVVKHSLSSEKLGEEYIDRISNRKDLSIVLEHLVKVGILAREYFPVSTRIEHIQKFILSKDWVNAEKEAFEGLKQGSEAEKARYSELLEMIYNASNPEKLETLWSAQGQAYIETSQLTEARKVYEKAFKRFKNFNTAFDLAHVFGEQKSIEKSVQIYYEASEIALLNEEFEKVSQCIIAIRKIDPKMETLDSNKKVQLLTQSQLLKVSATLQSQQRALFRVLHLIPGKHHKNLIESLLSYAVAQGEADVIKMVIEQADLIDINAYISNEPLIISAARAGQEEAVRALLTHPDINIDCKRTTRPTGTALSVAEQAGHKNIVTILYDHSKALKEELLAFKNKPLGATEHLHIYNYQARSGQQCLIFIGIDQKGNRKLLDVTVQPKETWQNHLKQLEGRGLKEVKFVTMTGNDPNRSRRARELQSSSSFPMAPIYSESEEIRKQLGADVANTYKEISEQMTVFIKSACSGPIREEVVYRALKFKGKGYLTS
ncbi:MAG: hypothetical protein K1060chlam2_01008 [Chlamydiae bacterium]|nr:hypothetical protein [Chlamydiota bacterium]